MIAILRFRSSLVMQRLVLFRLALFLLLLLVSVNASDSPVLPSEPLKSADGLAASISNSALGRQRSAESSLPNNEPTKKTQHNGRWQAFIASFAVIFVSEIGDKTFLIAAIMAMKNRRSTIFLAASSALVVMTVLSAGLGYAVPNLISRTYTQTLAAVLFLVFGLKMLREGYEMDAMEGQKEMAEVEEELAERGVGDTKRRDLEGGALPPSPSKLVAGPAETIFASVTALAESAVSPVFAQTFIMTFLAEWGDRSQIATIALAAAEDVFWVTFGAALAHCLCTGAAVVGGRLLAAKISVRTVTLVGGAIFVLFSVFTAMMLKRGESADGGD